MNDVNDANKGRWWLLAQLCLPTLSILLSTNIVMVALVPIAQAFPDIPNIGEWTLLIYSITAASLSIPAGDLGDRFGLRRIYGIALLMFLMGAIGAALAASGPLLIGFRMLSGMGAAVLAPVALAYLTRLFQGEEKPIAFGYWAASVTIGTVAGPILGGWIQTVASWRFTFPMAAVPALLALLLLHRLPAFRPDQPMPPFDWRGMAGLVTLPFLSLFTLTMAGRLSPATVLILMAAIVSLFLWTWHHLRVGSHPVIDVDRLHQVSWWRPSLLQLIIRCLFMAMLVLLTGYFHSIKGLSALEASQSLLPFLIAVGVMSLSSGYLCRAIGVRRMLVGVFGLAFVGVVILLSVGADGFRWIDWLAITAIGLLAGNTSQLSRLALANFPPQESMRGASLNTLVINLGLSLGAAYPSLVRSIMAHNIRLGDVIPKDELLSIMHEELMVMVLLFSIGIWQASRLKVTQ